MSTLRHKGQPRSKRRRKRGRILIVLGIVLIAAAAGLAGYNVWDSNRAGQASQEILEELELGDAQDSTAGSESQGAEAGTEDGSASSGTASSESVDGMPAKTVKGYECIGAVSVPSLNIELPVLATWSYPQLRVAPCRYSGSYLTDDLVVCGHNYARHFSPLRNVAIGTDVYFTSVNGDRVHYIVSNRETLQPTAVDQMVENDRNSESANEWDLTLFTCDLGGQTRCAVRCVRQ